MESSILRRAEGEAVRPHLFWPAMAFSILALVCRGQELDSVEWQGHAGEPGALINRRSGLAGGALAGLAGTAAPLLVALCARVALCTMVTHLLWLDMVAGRGIQ